VELSIGERLVLLALLPREGSSATLRLVRRLRRDLLFTEAEQRQWQMRVDAASGMVLWDDTQTLQKDVPIGLTAMALIRDALTQRSQQHRLPESWLDVYDRFVGEE
jgi:hypothetical protein